MSDLYPQTKPDSPLPLLSLIFAFVFPLAGVIMGHIALSQIRDGKINGKDLGLAKAGTIVSWVFMALGVLFIFLYIGFFAFLVSSGAFETY